MWGYISQINSTLLLNSEHFGNEVVAREDKSSQGLENWLSLNEDESVQDQRLKARVTQLESQESATLMVTEGNPH
jgi:hypothetical protein